MMLLQELIDKATLQAGIPDPQGSATRIEIVANSLLGQVFEEAAKGLSYGSLPRLTKTISFVNGTATLTTDVLTGLLSDSDLYDPADPTKIYSYVPAWEDFIRVYDTRIGYFTIRGGTSIYVIEPGSTYVDASGISGDRTLVVAGVPAIPALATSVISAPAEFTNRALDVLVERLRGTVQAA